MGSSTGRPGDYQEVASAGDATEVAAEGEDVVGEGWAEEEVRRRAGNQFGPAAIEECRVLVPRAIAVGVGSMDDFSRTRSTLSCPLVDPLRLSAVQDSGASDPAQSCVPFFPRVHLQLISPESGTYCTFCKTCSALCAIFSTTSLDLLAAGV